MYRSRSLSYIAGAALIILSLYTLFSYTRTTNPEILQHKSSYDSSVKPSILENVPSEDIPHQNSPGEDAASQLSDQKSHDTIPGSGPPSNNLDGLIQDAERQFTALLKKETHSLQDAAAAYRERRGRHPPPGFDHWYKYAKDNKAIVVEEFWDQIYHDLNPFWALKPALIRAQARKLGMGAEVADGKVVETADWFWHEIWGRMIGTVAEWLPNMFVPMNPMDESRLLVRWENMTEFMAKVHREKSIVDPKNVIRHVKGWNSKDKEPEIAVPDEKWNGFNPYNYARRACPPDSPARKISGVLSASEVMGFRNMQKPKVDVKQYFDNGFVTNYTEASDFCTDATIGGLHGALMIPLTCSNSDVLMPMFGGSKFHVNNEILLPAPMYWNGEERFGGDGGDFTPWKQKQDKVVWRGTATGGRNKPFNWYMYHRHRFVAMVNGTRYQNTDKKGHDLIFNELLEESAIKSLNPSIKEHLADWLKSAHNVAFTDLVCDENEPDGSCWFTKDEYAQVPGIQFTEQFSTKYLPDIDGNSFSGRYRAFLLSNSLPIKATIYREWHDSRLMAWKHFVPMNNRFSDYYRILEYFVGDVTRGIAGRDDQAEKIAIEGRRWSEKVLRKVDMQIYVMRLLLEYGRITDDDRLNVGWVDDLIGPEIRVKGAEDPAVAGS